MNALQIYKDDRFGEIRTVEVNGEPWFVGKDVAVALGYKNPRQGVATNVDVDDKGVHSVDTPYGTQEMTIINESGLYSLILSSKLPTAKAFKRWVTSEVIPSIRRHGGYLQGQETMTDAELLAKALVVANSQLEERQKRIADLERKAALDAPKVRFADAVRASHTSILVGELAKLMKQNGVNIGRNRLFAWFRDNDWLMKQGWQDYNSPTQKSMNMGLFEIVEKTLINPDGSVRITRTTKVTGKGQIYFMNKFLGDTMKENQTVLAEV